MKNLASSPLRSSRLFPFAAQLQVPAGWWASACRFADVCGVHRHSAILSHRVRNAYRG